MVEVKEFTPVDIVISIYKKWWLFMTLTLLGGVLGWGFHRLQPPVYETSSIFTTNINLIQSGPLTEFEQDHSIGIVRAILLSTPVIERLWAEAAARQIPEEALIYGRSLFLERRQFEYELRVRYSDPNTAAAVANLWADIGNEALLDAYHHSQRAEALRVYLSSLEKCPELHLAGTPATGLCQLTPAEVRAEVDKVQAELEGEFLAAKGLIPSLSFDLTQTALVPQTPVAFGANLLVFAGALAGFLFAAAYAAVKAARL